MDAPIPKKIKTSYAEFFRIKEALDKVTVSTDYVKNTKIKGNFKDWYEYAKKGFYAYDYQDGKYVLIASPKKPLKADSFKLNFFKMKCDFSNETTLPAI